MPDSPGPQDPDGPPEFGEDPETAGDELSSVVFDERFVRAARIHEPSAAERLLAAAPPPSPPTPGIEPPERAEPPFLLEPPPSAWRFDDLHDPEPLAPGEPDPGPVRSGWWRQSVAWVLALVMGIGVVAMAITAVTPSRGGQSPQGPQPTMGTPVPGKDGAPQAPSATGGSTATGTQADRTPGTFAPAVVGATRPAPVTPCIPRLPPGTGCV